MKWQKNNNYYFSASSYIFVSYYLSQQLKWLPEASMILSHVDPLPHLIYDTSTENAYTTFSRHGLRAVKHAETMINKKKNNRKIGNSYDYTNSTNRYTNTTTFDEYDDEDNQCSNWYRKFIKVSSSFSLFLASFLLYLGTCPGLIQRVIVTLPNPLFASFVGSAVILFVNIDFYFWMIYFIPVLVAVGLLVSFFVRVIYKIIEKYQSEMDVREEEKKNLQHCLEDAAQKNVIVLPPDTTSTDNNKAKNNISDSDTGDDSDDHDHDICQTTTTSNAFIEKEVHSIRANAEIRELRRQESALRRQKLQHENLKKRIVSRGGNKKSITFGKRGASTRVSSLCAQ
jgi:hypothetical protein